MHSKSAQIFFINIIYRIMYVFNVFSCRVVILKRTRYHLEFLFSISKLKICSWIFHPANKWRFTPLLKHPKSLSTWRDLAHKFVGTITNRHHSRSSFKPVQASCGSLWTRCVTDDYLAQPPTSRVCVCVMTWTTAGDWFPAVFCRKWQRTSEPGRPGPGPDEHCPCGATVDF